MGLSGSGRVEARGAGLGSHGGLQPRGVAWRGVRIADSTVMRIGSPVLRASASLHHVLALAPLPTHSSPIPPLTHPQPPRQHAVRDRRPLYLPLRLCFIVLFSFRSPLMQAPSPRHPDNHAPPTKPHPATPGRTQPSVPHLQPARPHAVGEPPVDGPDDGGGERQRVRIQRRNSHLLVHSPHCAREQARGNGDELGKGDGRQRA